MMYAIFFLIFILTLCICLSIKKIQARQKQKTPVYPPINSTALELADKLKKHLSNDVKVEILNESQFDLIRLTPPVSARGSEGIDAEEKFFEKYNWSSNSFGKTTWFQFMKDADTGFFKKAKFEYSDDTFVPLTPKSAAFFKGLQMGLGEPAIIVEPDLNTKTDSVLIKRYSHGRINQ